jgi:hypothetical protein
VADNLTGTITAGTITAGTFGASPGSMCDPALERLTINRMLSSGTNLSETFGQQVLRANADDQSLAIAARRKFELDISNQSSALDILQQRAVQAQPQTTGQLVSAAPFVVPAAPAPATKVIAVSSTGQITTA